MKNILFVLIFFLGLPQQTKAQVSIIEGLGKFKPGKTTISIIKDLENELGVKQEPYPKNRPNLKKTKIYFKAGETPGFKYYTVQNYQLAGIKIKYFRMCFFNDTLSIFQIEGTDSKVEFVRNISFEQEYRIFVEAFKQKYGEPQYITKEKISNTCSSEKTLFERMTWKGDMVILEATQFRYWIDCEPAVDSEINLYLLENHPLMQSYLKALRAKNKKQSKINLDDF